MATYSKHILSGSTDGRPVKVSATATPGTLIHTAHATAQDEVWIYANNTGPDPVGLTIEFGGTTSPDDLIVVGVPSRQGLIVVIPGVVLENSNLVRAFADAADKINITGWINRIT